MNDLHIIQSQLKRPVIRLFTVAVPFYFAAVRSMTMGNRNKNKHLSVFLKKVNIAHQFTLKTHTNVVKYNKSRGQDVSICHFLGLGHLFVVLSYVYHIIAH